MFFYFFVEFRVFGPEQNGPARFGEIVGLAASQTDNAEAPFIIIFFRTVFERLGERFRAVRISQVFVDRRGAALPFDISEHRAAVRQRTREQS